jgi:hypothetical protein
LFLIALGIAFQRLGNPPAPSPVLKELTFYVRRGGDSEHIYRKNLVVNGLEQELEPIDPPLAPEDDFKLIGAFQQPTYWYLLWFDTAGQVEVAAHSDTPQTEVQFPIRKESMELVNPADPPGVHWLLLVAGSVPPAKGVPRLVRQFEGVGKPPAELAKQWNLQLRGAGGERPVDSNLFPVAFLHAIKHRLPPGLEVVHVVSLQTKK